MTLSMHVLCGTTNTNLFIQAIGDHEEIPTATVQSLI